MKLTQKQCNEMSIHTATKQSDGGA